MSGRRTQELITDPVVRGPGPAAWLAKKEEELTTLLKRLCSSKDEEIRMLRQELVRVKQDNERLHGELKRARDDSTPENKRPRLDYLRYLDILEAQWQPPLPHNELAKRLQQERERSVESLRRQDELQIENQQLAKQIAGQSKQREVEELRNKAANEPGFFGAPFGAPMSPPTPLPRRSILKTARKRYPGL
eukprot:Hpha_TRINITY_DN15207_c2_g9::TRINITY_DN15207_c2_g9_i1::g.67033::m.67033